MTETTIVNCEYVGYSRIVANDTQNPDYTSSRTNHGIEYYALYAFKFITPQFLGVSKGFTINLTRPTDGYYGSASSIRYAVCDSDENWNKYAGQSDVVDEHQLASGQIDVSTYETDTIFVKSGNIKPNTPYYLFLWDAKDGADILIDSHLATLEYFSSFVYIDNGTEFLSYQCYIDNGTNWDLYVPYIDNGSSWDLYT